MAYKDCLVGLVMQTHFGAKSQAPRWYGTGGYLNKWKSMLYF